MDTAQFSVVVPIYNTRSEYLHQCVRSILAQTVEDFELILVDDGSPDRCPAICDEYAALDGRVKVIHKTNGGLSDARNRGLEAARGEWVLFVDSDDWIEPHTLETVKRYMETRDFDVLHFESVREERRGAVHMPTGLENGKVYDLRNPEEKEYLYRRTMQVPLAGKRRCRPLYHAWDKIFRRSLLMDHDLRYPKGLKKSEDKVFMLNCLMHVEKYLHIPDVLHHYRIHMESICNRYSVGMDQARLELAEYLAEIGARMDRELGNALGDPDYCAVTQDAQRFLFGIISDVLVLQYYHRDNPDRRNRRKEALRFLHREPIWAAVRNVPYASLSRGAKVKKWLLLHECVGLFALLKTIAG